MKEKLSFEDPKFWKFLEALDNLPNYLKEKELKRQERIKFVDRVWRKALEDAGIIPLVEKNLHSREPQKSII